MKKVLFSVLIFAVAISFSTAGYALELTKTEDMDHHKIWHKLRRGATNIVTSPLEIPKQIKEEYASGSTKTGAKVASTFGGFFKGVAYFGGRLGTGLWDVVTCNLPIPKNYEPVMTPEFVFGK